MRLDSLAQLHQSMKEQKIDLQQFSIKAGSATFGCLFSLLHPKARTFNFSNLKFNVDMRLRHTLEK